MHLEQVVIRDATFPTREHYPFTLRILKQPFRIEFRTPVTFFVGENATGKSTILQAIAMKCGITIWKGIERRRADNNPYREMLHRSLEICWKDGPVPGSFFSSDIFRHFAESLDEWASADPGVLEYFGGKSLISQSHGQSIMSFFQSRYSRKGLYLIDEPETALSPKSQIRLLKLLGELSSAGGVQFIIISHSPILLACPNARLYNFDSAPVSPFSYEESDYYRVYRSFLLNRELYL